MDGYAAIITQFKCSLICLNICTRKKIFNFGAGQNPTRQVDSTVYLYRWVGNSSHSFFLLLPFFFSNVTCVLSCSLPGGWLISFYNAITIQTQSLHFTTFITTWLDLLTWKGTFVRFLRLQWTNQTVKYLITVLFTGRMLTKDNLFCFGWINKKNHQIKKKQVWNDSLQTEKWKNWLEQVMHIKPVFILLHNPHPLLSYLKLTN